MFAAIRPPRPRSIAVGFAGKQGREYLSLLRKHTDLVGLVDTSPDGRCAAEQSRVPYFDEVESALKAVDFDLALVTIPHSAHFAVCELLLEHRKHVIKEKPFAIRPRDAALLSKLATEADRSVYTLVQRSFVPTFGFVARNLSRIGRPYWFSYEYHMDIPAVTSGWRADYSQALGGVMLDMGYHLIDVVNRFFGLPSSVQSTFLHCYEEMRLRHLEDLANVQLYYPGTAMAGSVTVSRHHHDKAERLTILGSEGSLDLAPGAAELRSRRGGPIDDLAAGTSKDDAVEAMFTHFVHHLEDRDYRRAHLARQESTVRLIDGIYKSSAHRLPNGAASAVTIDTWG